MICGRLLFPLLFVRECLALGRLELKQEPNLLRVSNASLANLVEEQSCIF